MYLVSRTETFIKLFFAVSVCGLFLYLVLAFYSLHTALSDLKSDITAKPVKLIADLNPIIEKEKFVKELKYALIWTSVEVNKYPEEGQQLLIDNKCLYVNCYLTMNKSFFMEGYKNFDAIVFNISPKYNWQKIYLPKMRSPHQKYVFHSMLPADENPICNEYLDNYFNWTWSYKLYSDIVTQFIVVIDMSGKIIAPEPNMECHAIWTNRFNITETKRKKPKALLMINHNIKHAHKAEFIKQLKFVMKEHGLAFDILECNKDLKKGCLDIKYEDYYFYLIHEKGTSEDFITQSVLTAFDNNIIPIPINGPDYDNFLPPGSYIDARDMSPEKLAAVTDYTILNQFTYNNYFYWKNHYTVDEVDTQIGFCELCRLLNVEGSRKYRVYEHFRKWWYYGPLKDRCYPKGFVNESELISYMNLTNLGYQNA